MIVPTREGGERTKTIVTKAIVIKHKRSLQQTLLIADKQMLRRLQ